MRLKNTNGLIVKVWHQKRANQHCIPYVLNECCVRDIGGQLVARGVCILPAEAE
jgi:hypothetical protein